MSERTVRVEEPFERRLDRQDRLNRAEAALRLAREALLYDHDDGHDGECLSQEALKAIAEVLGE